MLIEGDTSYWFESGAVSNIELYNNKFINCSYIPAWGNAPIQVTPSAGYREGTFYHQCLNVHDNDFKLIDNRILYARNIKDIIFKNNRFTSSDFYPAIEGKAYDTQHIGSLQC